MSNSELQRISIAYIKEGRKLKLYEFDFHETHAFPTTVRVDLLCRISHTYRSRNMESAGTSSFMAISKVWLPPSRFSWNSLFIYNLLNRIWKLKKIRQTVESLILGHKQKDGQERFSQKRFPLLRKQHLRNLQSRNCCMIKRRQRS
jgi:hypothetical protein